MLGAHGGSEVDGLYGDAVKRARRRAGREGFLILLACDGWRQLQLVEHRRMGEHAHTVRSGDGGRAGGVWKGIEIHGGDEQVV